MTRVTELYRKIKGPCRGFRGGQRSERARLGRLRSKGTARQLGASVRRA